MSSQLNGKRVAILATDGFEQTELLYPRKALIAEGALTYVIAPAEGKIKGWSGNSWGALVPVDVPLRAADPSRYDALLLPGGVLNADNLRTIPAAVQFVRYFFDHGRPVAAICHGPWMLVEADVLRGRRLTSWPSLRTDIQNAGGQWTDEEVIVDQTLVTSRKPTDLPVFNRKMIEAFQS